MVKTYVTVHALSTMAGRLMPDVTTSLNAIDAMLLPYPSSGPTQVQVTPQTPVEPQFETKTRHLPGPIALFTSIIVVQAPATVVETVERTPDATKTQETPIAHFKDPIANHAIPTASHFPLWPSETNALASSLYEKVTPVRISLMANPTFAAVWSSMMAREDAGAQYKCVEQVNAQPVTAAKTYAECWEELPGDFKRIWRDYDHVEAEARWKAYDNIRRRRNGAPGVMATAKAGMLFAVLRRARRGLWWRCFEQYVRVRERESVLF